MLAKSYNIWPAMERDIYLKRFFPRQAIPHYLCPRCGAHMRSGVPEEEDRADSKQNRHIDGYGHEDERSVFHIKLECTHPKCGEPVFVIGEGTVEYEDTGDDKGSGGYEYVTWYEPKFFMPHLRMFKIPEKTPFSVAESVNASFNLFFVSSGSALNEIRNAVEFLMDELGVPRKGPNEATPPEEVRWDLDTRVGKLSGEHRKYKQHLQAIKNLGNWGSHAVKTNRRDVLDAYEVLHYVLDGIYNQRDVYVTSLAQRIKADKRGLI